MVERLKMVGHISKKLKLLPPIKYLQKLIAIRNRYMLTVTLGSIYQIEFDKAKKLFEYYG